MSSKPLIHIGYNKTGTTWFQNNFFPFVTNANLINRATAHRLLINSNYFLFNANEVRNELTKHTDKRIIISEEEFCLSVRAKSYTKTALIKQLHQVFPEAQIVVFIRNQVERLLSLYLYYLKQNGGTYSFQNFLFKKNRSYGNIFNQRLENSRYHHFINFLCEIFGQQNVHIYLYEEFAQNNALFINKFCQAHNLEVNTEALHFSRVNSALKRNFIPIARFANLFTEPHIVNRSHFITIPYLDRVCKRLYPKINRWEIWGRNAEPKDLLDKQTLNYLNHYFQDSNRILMEQHALPLDKYGYPL